MTSEPWILTAPLGEIEWREAQNGRSDEWTVTGHAAVFGALSEDLGGFREVLEPGAFRSALARNPDVRLLSNHNPDYVLARTRSRTLEVREDDHGLRVWARVAPLTWIDDLRRSMQRGDIDQMSFAFTLADGGDDWAVENDGTTVRTIRADGVRELFDVSIVTYPAYPAARAAIRARALEEAIRSGRVPSLARPVAEAIPAPEVEVDGEQARERLRVLRAKSRRAVLAIDSMKEPQDEQDSGRTGRAPRGRGAAPRGR